MKSAKTETVESRQAKVVTTQLAIALEALDNATALLNTTKKICKSCQLTHYVNWLEAQAEKELRAAANKVKKYEAFFRQAIDDTAEIEDSEEKEASVRLHAAAPDLLAFAEHYVASQDFCVVSGGAERATCECAVCALNREARAVIARARNKFCAHGNEPKYCEICHPELESEEDREARGA